MARAKSIPILPDVAMMDTSGPGEVTLHEPWPGFFLTDRQAKGPFKGPRFTEPDGSAREPGQM